MNDSSSGDQYPTKRNILQQLRLLVEKAKRGQLNEIWISFSGHGAHITDRSQDEVDGRDEAIFTLDQQIITDDAINSYLAQIPRTCQVMCLFDCCHSGTVTDLKYQYSTERGPARRQLTRQRRRVKITRRGRMYYRYRWVREWKLVPGRWEWKRSYHPKSQQLSGRIVTISGCRDSQTSADILLTRASDWGGALTNSFINIVKSCRSRLTFRSLTEQLNNSMERLNLTQTPVISSSCTLRGGSIFYSKNQRSSGRRPRRRPRRRYGRRYGRR